ncbi:hypothetical protein ACIP01_21630 [Pseudomonas monteilii]|uniref:hypothetical protein n=1 Tax=Pseudomonas monteilii TaxID=76759 RepID=UPI0038293651
MAPKKAKDDVALDLLIAMLRELPQSNASLKASLEHSQNVEAYTGLSLLYAHNNAAVLRVGIEGGLTLWYGILYDFDKRLEGSGVLSEKGVRCAFLGPGIRHDQSTDGTYSVTRAENGDITEVEFKATGTRDHSTMDMRAKRIRSK